MGEQTFKKWCVDEGLTVNESNPDKMGWDFIVEFQPEIDAAVPLDRQHISKRLLVQAKSSDRSSSSVQAKPSALKRLVDNSDPSFIAHLEYASGNQPSRARLLHIGKEEISAILRAVRELQAKGRTDLHNKKITLSLASAVELKPDGSEILQELYDATPSDLAAYTAEKDRLRKSVGNGRGTIKASFVIARSTGEEELVDLLIGRTKKLRVDRLTIRKSRFQIELKEDVEELVDVVLSVEPQGRDIMLRVVDGDGFTRTEVAAKAFRPNIVDLPDHVTRTRIANEFIECILLPDGVGSLKVGIPPDQKFDIHKLEQMLRFGVHLGRPDSKFQIVIDDDHAFDAVKPENIDYLLTWSATHLLCQQMSRAIFNAGRNLPTLLSIDDVTRIMDENEFMISASRNADISFEVEVDENLPETMPDRGFIFLPIIIRMDDLLYLAVNKASVRARRTGKDTVKFITGKPEVIDETVIPYSEEMEETWNRRNVFHARQERQEGIWIVTPRAGKNRQLTIEA